MSLSLKINGQTDESYIILEKKKDSDLFLELVYFYRVWSVSADLFFFQGVIIINYSLYSMTIK